MRVGLQTGLRPRMLPGLSPPWVPSTAAEWGAALPSVTTPDGLWLFDEASGDFLDRIGSNDFSVAAGTVTRGVPIGGRLGVQLNSSSTSLAVSSTTFMDGGSDTDISILVVASFPAFTSTNRALASKRGGVDNPGWVLLANGNPTGRASSFIAPGGDLATVAGKYDERPQPFLFELDWSEGLICSAGGDEAIDASLPATDITTSAALTLGAYTLSSTEAGVALGPVMAWDGHALTAAERALLIEFFRV